ncbi:hypothetical protein [Nostoc sp.]
MVKVTETTPVPTLWEGVPLTTFLDRATNELAPFGVSLSGR